MDVELQYVDGCPHRAVAEERLREALRLAGREDVSILMHRIETHEDAVALGFTGSPTSSSAAPTRWRRGRRCPA